MSESVEPFYGDSPNTVTQMKFSGRSQARESFQGFH